MSQTLLAMAKDLVMAQIAAHRLSPDDMHTALQQTYASLKALQAQEDAHGSVAVVTPATPPARVNWRKSITKHTVIGSTSEGTWIGWTVISSEIRDSSYPIVSRQRDHVKTEGGRAAVETVGEGSDLCESTGGEEAGENYGSTKEKDGEGESVRKSRKMNNGRTRETFFLGYAAIAHKY